MIIDRIGDGVKIDFPVKVRLFMGWSPKIHSCRPGKLNISFSKAACSLS